MQNILKLKTPMILTTLVGLTLATAQISAAADKAAAVNCSSAKQDVATLQKEKVSVLREMGAGAQTFIPIGALIGILGGKYDQNARIAGGQYNKDIESRIVEIKQACGV